VAVRNRLIVALIHSNEILRRIRLFSLNKGISDCAPKKNMKARRSKAPAYR
jgi:hypothetical protein